jgi:glucosamine--fructose-6-phosphate aminotransferase (isomerizing)
MCGVVGLIPHQAHPDIEKELTDSLGLLLYRGYDSVGIACQKSGKKVVVTKMKAEGQQPHLKLFENIDRTKPTSIAIGHSRWATHGPATDSNAHPHTDCTDTITLVHNGIIENMAEIKEYLAEQDSCPLEGHYKSDTDTEVAAHLIGYFRSKRGQEMREAVESALKIIRGSYAFLILDRTTPGTLIAARLGSPLLLGVRDRKTGQDMAIVSSAEPLANHGYTQIRALEDGDVVELKAGHYPGTVRFYKQGSAAPTPQLSVLDFKASFVDKGDNESFFEKEIREQGQVARTVIHSHYVNREARLGGFAGWKLEDLRKIRRVWFIAEGTSLHAAEVGADWFRRYADLDATTKLASEFALNPGRIDPHNTLHIVISQSGETADVRIAAEEIVRQGGKLFGLVNVVGSSIARLVSDHGGGMYTHAGPEISVASTKVYTGQLSQLAILTIFFARNVHGTMSPLDAEQWIAEHRKIPDLMEQTLECWQDVAQVAHKFVNAERGVLFIGRGPNLATAREGALKLRELSYLNAIGFSAGEMKHGTIALIDKDFPTVAVAPADRYYQKMVGNLHEIKARKGSIFAVVTQGDTEVRALVDDVVEIPATHEAFTPLLATIPLQILTNEVAKLRECPIDTPRNLAKSVTVQ